MAAEHNQEAQLAVLTSLEQQRKGEVGLIVHAVDTDNILRRKKADDSKLVITL
jgi:hypothetical protein